MSKDFWSGMLAKIGKSLLAGVIADGVLHLTYKAFKNTEDGTKDIFGRELPEEKQRKTRLNRHRQVVLGTDDFRIS